MQDRGPLTRAFLALSLLACVACSLSVRTVRFEGTRQERFLYGVRHYQEVAGLEEASLAFTFGEFPGHPEYCAWVVADPNRYFGAVVGLNTVNPRCHHRAPEWLALHEVCHLEMRHTSYPLDSALSNEGKEREATECMRSYDARRRK